MSFSVEQKSRNVHQVVMQGDSASWEQWFLLTGDRHVDSADSDHAMQVKHLRQAQERDAGVIDVGDVLDAMQGRSDPRRMKGVGRPDSAIVANYLDRIVVDAAEMLAPYARRFVVIGRGNHEQSILRHCETDLTERLCERISLLSGTKVHSGGYGGWVRFVVRWSTKGGLCLNLKYFHGSGGGGLMSFDTLRVRRQSSFVSGADVVVCGHVHERWALEITQEEPAAMKGCYELRHRSQWHVRVGTYKDEYREGLGGWHIERGGPPKPLGAYWMRVSMYRKRIDGVERLRPRVELVAT